MKAWNMIMSNWYWMRVHYCHPLVRVRPFLEVSRHKVLPVVAGGYWVRKVGPKSWDPWEDERLRPHPLLPKLVIIMQEVLQLFRVRRLRVRKMMSIQGLVTCMILHSLRMRSYVPVWVVSVSVAVAVDC